MGLQVSSDLDSEILEKVNKSLMYCIIPTKEKWQNPVPTRKEHVKISYQLQKVKGFQRASVGKWSENKLAMFPEI